MTPSRRYLALIMPPLWVVACGVVDWRMGPELATSAFYLPAIALSGWYCGRRWAFLIAVLAAGTWLMAELPWGTRFTSFIVPYWNAGVRLLVFLMTAYLVSEIRIRRLAETALREQREILSSILDTITEGVAVIDSSGKVILFNPASRLLFQRDALGRPASDWIAEFTGDFAAAYDGIGLAAKALTDAIKASGETHGKITFDGPDGSDRFIAFSSLPLQVAGNPKEGRIMVFSDLTAQRQFEKQVAKATQLEQRRIAQDLHDGLSQHLAGVAFAADTLQESLLKSGMKPEATNAEEIAWLIREGIHQTKTLARGLFPTGLEESLATALHNLAITAETRSGIPCIFSPQGDDHPLPPDTAGHLFRIAQESVSNGLHHADARQIQIRLAQGPNNLTLEISDDGTGIPDAAATSTGIGLQIIRHRAHLIGANLTVESSPGAGTTVSCHLPISTNRIS